MKFLKQLPYLFATLLVLSACAPVNLTTRIKNIPRAYSLNYADGEGIKAKKSDINKNPWVVFSDRENNASYNNAAGKVKTKDIGYLDPFLVIGKKGDYLKLIKYTPSILKNGKLDYKKAEYYGWMDQSTLLLNEQSETNLATGLKNKNLVVFSDTLRSSDPEKYFVTDSIKVFKDLAYTTQAGAILPQSIVYVMKHSKDGTQVLIANKSQIRVDHVKTDILGWIDSKLIGNIGQRLHVNGKTAPLAWTQEMNEKHGDLSDQYEALKYTPALFYSTKDSSVAYKNLSVLPVLDRSDNYIFNVKGDHILFRDFREIRNKLHHINISFVFEGGDHTIQQFPELVNALQNLQSVFEQNNDKYSYQFSTVLTFGDAKDKNKHSPIVTPLYADYTKTINFLTDKASHREELSSIHINAPAWAGLKAGIHQFDKQSDATNIIILMGEVGSVSNDSDSYINQKLLENNCRLLGFQTYAGDENRYNNYVLEIENMIDFYANGMLKQKENMLVFPQQIRRENLFKQVHKEKNEYCLDFPDHAATQGAILFPEKGKTLSLDILTNNVDTLLEQVKQDNDNVILNMNKAFSSVGNNRTQYDHLYALHFGLDSLEASNRSFINRFKTQNPAWILLSHRLVIQDSINNHTDFELLLSKSELNDLKDFINKLSAKEVEYSYQAVAKHKSKSKEELTKQNLFVNPFLGEENHKYAIPDSSQQSAQYAGTRRVRHYLYKFYLKSIRADKLCKPKVDLHSLSLAEAQRLITSCPSSTPLLQSIDVKSLKNHDKVTDKQLDELITYFKHKRKDLDKAEKFESNGQTYYWVSETLLP